MFGHDHGPFDTILQLPDIPRPGIVFNGRHRVLAEIVTLFALLLADALKEHARQQQGVAFAFSQGRNGNIDLTHPVIEIFTKLVGTNQFMQVLVGGTQHAHIHRNFLAATDTLNDALLQEAQQLGLQRRGHIADLVQEQRATGRGFDLARCLPGRTGKGAFFIAEQLALQQVLGNRSTVNGDKASFLSLAQLMQRLGHQLLTGTRLAQDQHRGIRRRDLFHRAADLQHAGTASDHPFKRRLELLRTEAPVFFLKFINAVGPIDDQLKHVGIDRLVEKIVGTHGHGAGGMLAVIIAGDDDDLGMRRLLQDIFQQ